MIDCLDTLYPVDGGTAERFVNEGFVRIRGALDPQCLADFGPIITRKTLELNEDHRPLEERSTYDRAFLQVMNLWREDGAVRRFVFARRLAGIAADLMGVRAVRLYHDQSLYKEPGGGITPAHADQYYWPFTSDRTITAWIPLQDVPHDLGPLAFYRGSHRESFGRDIAISDESEAAISRVMEARGFPIDEEPYALGDVSFHGGWTFHRAGANKSNRPRSVMTMIYIDANIKVAKPRNAMQQSDLERWLPGLAPGDIAASPLNPILYPGW
jgi:ectoine hydroxylase-related dioxygenase (phytanoyl-CoA dioxygenase family)